VTTKLNRQSRKVGTVTWTDQGDVSLKQAAIQEASNWPIGQECLVEVRDAPDSKRIWTLRVTTEAVATVKGLRVKGQ